MSFFAIVLALLIEQARPLPEGNPVHALMGSWARWVARQTDAGQHANAWLAWGLAVVLPAVLAGAVYWLLWWFSAVLAFVWLVLVLYLTLGFRQFSHHFTQVRDALDAGDPEAARQAFAQWYPAPVAEGPPVAWLKAFLAHAVLNAHRHVFGVLTAFLVFWWLGLGPAGAVLYRLGEQVLRQWRPRPLQDGEPGPSEALGHAAQRAWNLLDHVPARLTAGAFAVVGNFEEAVASWRGEADVHGPGSDGVVLAAAAGALNLQLAMPVSLSADGPSATRPDPQPAHLSSVVGLVWRAVVLLLLLLALLGLARLPL